MSDENTDGQNQSGSDDQNTNKNKNDQSSVNIDEIVQQKVAENLKDIKTKLDSAYNARDEALKKVAEFEAKQKADEIARLKEEGKHREAYERELAEERSRRETLEKRNIELTRDIDVKSVLQTLPFKNQKSQDMAYKEIVSELVQNDKGEWVHKTGLSVQDFVKAYGENNDNAFLFKQKTSSGTGSSGGTGNPDVSGDKKSLFDMPQEMVLNLAAEGKLPRGT